MIKKLILILTLMLVFNYMQASEPIINLHLSNNYKIDNTDVGVALILIGTVITVSIIGEGNYSYTGVPKKYPGNPYYYKNVTPFLAQTPRQIYFFTGLAVIGTGLYITIDNLKLHFK